MITAEEYLKAKAIVEEYERLHYEEQSRIAEAYFNQDDDPDPDNECEYCTCLHGNHYSGCIEKDPLDYNECGYG